MGSHSGFFKGEKKKKRKETIEREVEKINSGNYLPKVEILGKKGKK